jgi:hypothetical protein
MVASRLLKIVTALSLVILTSSFFSSANGNDNNLDKELKKEKTVPQLEALLNNNKDKADQIVPRIESMIVKEIKSKGLGNRFFLGVNPSILASQEKEVQNELNKKNSEEKTLTMNIAKILLKYHEKYPEISWNVLPNSKMTYGDGTTIISLSEPMNISTSSEGHFPGDSTSSDDVRSDPLARFSGKVAIGKYVFVGEGDRSNLLTFLKFDLKGKSVRAYSKLVYVRGKGKVILPDGKVIKLGQ